MTAYVPTGPGDLRDQRWLDERIEAINDGMEAVVDIARNWTDGRNVSRFHPGMSAAEYVIGRVGVLGKAVVPVLLAESNWSNRQIAAVAGLSHDTVNRAARQLDEIVQLPARTASDVAVDEPRTTLGADNKLRTYAPRTVEAVVIDDVPEPDGEEQPIDSALWDGLEDVLGRIEALTKSDAPAIAATVPFRRRAATARRIRKLGTYLGRIAWTLEGEGSDEQ